MSSAPQLPSYGDAALDAMFALGYNRIAEVDIEASVGCAPGGLKDWFNTHRPEMRAWGAGVKARDGKDSKELEEALFKAATGYDITESKPNRAGKIEDTLRHVPPDAGMALKMLGRLSAERWGREQDEGEGRVPGAYIAYAENVLIQAGHRSGGGGAPPLPAPSGAA